MTAIHTVPHRETNITVHRGWSRHGESDGLNYMS